MAQTYTSRTLKEFRWPLVVSEAKRNPDEEGIGWRFLGTVLALAPSGTYWVSWASRSWRAKEAQRDEAYFDALDKAAEKHGGWIERGADPLDVFFCIEIEED